MTVDRRTISEALNRLAFAAELLDDDSVDVKAASGLAWAIRQAEGELDDARLSLMDGMNAALFAVVDDAGHNRMPPLLAKLEAQIPQGLLEVRKIKGLGPKKIRALWKDLEITSIGELEYACNENRLVELKGFGGKTQETVLQGIAELRARAGRLRLDQALSLGESICEPLRAKGELAMVVGDARRAVETVDEVRIVTTATDVPDFSDADVKILVVTVARDRFWANVVRETGSREHVEKLEARSRGRSPAPWEIEANDEASVYRALGLAMSPVELREPEHPLFEEGKGPRLVRKEDLRGSLHNHTVASDGVATLDEMRAGATQRGYEYLAITEHSQSAVYAKGLVAAELERQSAAIVAANDTPGCKLISGVESDIQKDGALDYADEVLKKLTVVVASVHARYGQKGDDLTARMVRAAKHPLTDIVGHPTGRLLLGRPASEYDVAALLDACALSGCAVELNANPARLDLSDKHLAMAKERGVKVSIAADAHSVGALDHIDYGIRVARRAGLTPDDVINTRPLDALLEWLRARRATALSR